MEEQYTIRIYYFGTHQKLLEPLSLQSLCFGALWYEENGYRSIMGYAFGDNKVDVLNQFSNLSSCKECTDSNTVREVYMSIREKQQQQDWSTRLRFPIATVFKNPWKNTSTGWYVLRSRDTYPFHLSVVHKMKYQLWLEHSAVCENKPELLSFIEKAKRTHQVDLRFLES